MHGWMPMWLSSWMGWHDLQNTLLPRGKRKSTFSSNKKFHFLFFSFVSYLYLTPLSLPPSVPSAQLPVPPSLYSGILHPKWCRGSQTHTWLHPLLSTRDARCVRPRKHTRPVTTKRTLASTRMRVALWQAFLTQGWPVSGCSHSACQTHACGQLTCTHTHDHMSHLYGQPNGLVSAASPPVKLQ